MSGRTPAAAEASSRSDSRRPGVALETTTRPIDLRAIDTAHLHVRRVPHRRQAGDTLGERTRQTRCAAPARLRARGAQRVRRSRIGRGDRAAQDHQSSGTKPGGGPPILSALGHRQSGGLHTPALHCVEIVHRRTTLALTAIVCLALGGIDRLARRAGPGRRIGGGASRRSRPAGGRARASRPHHPGKAGARRGDASAAAGFVRGACRVGPRHQHATVPRARRSEDRQRPSHRCRRPDGAPAGARRAGRADSRHPRASGRDAGRGRPSSRARCGQPAGPC